MDKIKRVTLFAGHYGSGKTNVAVNYAIQLKDKGFDVDPNVLTVNEAADTIYEAVTKRK